MEEAEETIMLSFHIADDQRRDAFAALLSACLTYCFLYKWEEFVAVKGLAQPLQRPYYDTLTRKFEFR